VVKGASCLSLSRSSSSVKLSHSRAIFLCRCIVLPFACVISIANCLVLRYAICALSLPSVLLEIEHTWPRQTGQLIRGNALLLFFRISTLLHILHIRLSFGIVHSNIICSTISKITVRPREMGTRGNGGNIKSRQRGPSRLRLCFLQSDLSLTEWVTLPARVSAHAPQLSLSSSHYFLSDLMDNTTSKSLLAYW
jgi:hypothetical protein